MEKKPTIRSPQLQTFVDQANSNEIRSVMLQIKPLPVVIPRQEKEGQPTDAASMLPGPATATTVAAAYEEWKTAMVQAELQQQKLRALDHVLEKLGLSQQATRNASTGTVTLDVTPEQLKALASEPVIEAIVENKWRWC